MSLDLIMDEERMLYIDRDPEEGFILLGSYSPEGGGAITLSRNEVVDFYEALKVELQIKGVLAWDE